MIVPSQPRLVEQPQQQQQQQQQHQNSQQHHTLEKPSTSTSSSTAKKPISPTPPRPPPPPSPPRPQGHNRPPSPLALATIAVGSFLAFAYVARQRHDDPLKDQREKRIPHPNPLVPPRSQEPQ